MEAVSQQVKRVAVDVAKIGEVFVRPQFALDLDILECATHKLTVCELALDAGCAQNALGAEQFVYRPANHGADCRSDCNSNWATSSAQNATCNRTDIHCAVACATIQTIAA